MRSFIAVPLRVDLVACGRKCSGRLGLGEDFADVAEMESSTTQFTMFLRELTSTRGSSMEEYTLGFHDSNI